MKRFASWLIPLILAVPASADWIKTRDGARIETQGHWKVKGRLVVFKAMNGTLSAMQLSQVDLDSSGVAPVEAERANASPEATSKTERVPVLVVTNEDIARAAPDTEKAYEASDAAAGQGEATPGSPDTPDEASSEQPVKVISWRLSESSESGGIEIRGHIQNQHPGRHMVMDIRVFVHWFDGQGNPLGTSSAFLDARSLVPKSTAEFRAILPTVSASSVEPRFDIRSITIEIR